MKKLNNKPPTKEELLTKGVTNPDDYVKASTKNMIFLCDDCNTPYTISMSNYLCHSGLCKTCSNMTVNSDKKITKDVLIKHRCINPDDYKNYNCRNLVFGCTDCDNTYTSSFGKSLSRSTLCLDCTTNGFKPYKDVPTILYYVKINNLYKIGITIKSPELRFCKDDIKLVVLDTCLFNTGRDAYLKEQEVIKHFSDYKYTGVPILRSGNTELFTEDILRGTLDSVTNKIIKEFYEE